MKLSHNAASFPRGTLDYANMQICCFTAVRDKPPGSLRPIASMVGSACTPALSQKAPGCRLRQRDCTLSWQAPQGACVIAAACHGAFAGASPGAVQTRCRILFGKISGFFDDPTSSFAPFLRQFGFARCCVDLRLLAFRFGYDVVSQVFFLAKKARVR